MEHVAAESTTGLCYTEDFDPRMALVRIIQILLYIIRNKNATHFCYDKSYAYLMSTAINNPHKNCVQIILHFFLENSNASSRDTFLLTCVFYITKKDKL